MSIPATGAISFNAINVELGLPATTQISLNDTNIKNIIGLADNRPGAVSVNALHNEIYWKVENTIPGKRASSFRYVVPFGNKLIGFAVDSSGAAISTDGGINWTYQPGLEHAFGSFKSSSTIWDGSNIIAFGWGVCVTSPDGITWTNQYTYTDALAAYAISSGESDTFIASNSVYANGIYLATNDFLGAYMYSTNGISWQAIPLNYGMYPAVLSCIHDGTNFILLISAYDVNWTEVCFTAKSVDGITWISNSAPETDRGRMTFTGSEYVILTGDYPSYRTIKSTDLVTWTTYTGFDANINRTTVPYIQGYPTSLVYRNGVLIATGYGSVGCPIMYSTDAGVTWTPYYTTTSQVNSVYWTGSKFQAWPRNPVDGTFYESTNGTSWTNSTSTNLTTVLPNTGNYTKIYQQNNKFVAFGDNYATATSIDGVSWSQIDITPYINTTNYTTAQVVSNGTILALSGNSPHPIAKLVAGVFSSIPSNIIVGASNYRMSLSTINNSFAVFAYVLLDIIADSYTLVYTSANEGTTWTLLPTRAPVNKVFTTITAGSMTLILGGNDPTGAYYDYYHHTAAASTTSNSGITWTNQPGFNDALAAIGVTSAGTYSVQTIIGCWSGTKFVVLVRWISAAWVHTTTCLTSSDGVSWAIQSGFPTTMVPTVIKWVNNKFYAMGNNGAMNISEVYGVTSIDGITWINHQGMDALSGRCNTIYDMANNTTKLVVLGGIGRCLSTQII